MRLAAVTLTAALCFAAPGARAASCVAALGADEHRCDGQPVRFRLKSPPGWLREANLTAPAPALFRFTKEPDASPLPLILVMEDAASEDDRTVEDFARRMKAKLEQRATAPRSLLDGPVPATLGGQPAARLLIYADDGRVHVQSEWHQVMIGRAVVTIQYANYAGEFEADYPSYQLVLDSFVIERPMAAGTGREE